MGTRSHFFALQKAFGDQNYSIADVSYREKLINHPLIQGLWTLGPSFVLVTNTNTWKIELVSGDAKGITGYSCDEILNLQGTFILNFPVEEHAASNMTIVKMGMDYLNSRPVDERERILVNYFYYARTRTGEVLTIQHQSIPLLFDDNHIPFVFCNIYSDISYLKPGNIPMGLVINKSTNEIFDVNTKSHSLLHAKKVFSNREKDIIRLLISGNNSNQIAEKLFISPETVRTHRKNILRKAELSNTGQLIQYCLFNGAL